MSKRWILRLLAHGLTHWRSLLLLLAMIIAHAAASVLQPWPVKVAIDYVLTDKELPDWLNWLTILPSADTSAGLLIWLALATVLVFLIIQLLVLFKQVLNNAIGVALTTSFGAQVFDQLQRRSVAFHQARSIGDQVKRITKDTNCARMLIIDIGAPLLLSLATLASMLWVIWQIDPVMSLVAIGFALPLGVVIRLLSAEMNERSYEHAEQEGALMTTTERSLVSVPVIQAFSQQTRQREAFEEQANFTLQTFLRTLLSQLKFNAGVSTVTATGTAAVMAVGGYRVLSGHVTIGDLWIFLAYLQALYGPISRLAYVAQGIAEVRARARRVFELLDAKADVEEPSANRRQAPPEDGPLKVEFNDVYFGYEANRPILNHINLTIPAGHMTALVGGSGVGKSTMVSLIARFMDPWKGSITLGGMNIKNLSLKDLRARIAWVPQDPMLLPLTIGENIAYGQPDATLEEIRQAARLAEAADFIEKLEHGYDTPVGERNATLSGGQAQRVALARAILRKASVLILDEPTAALDALTERSIMRAVDQLEGKVTVVVIAHRLSTIRKARQIVILKNGQIAECGHHDELLTHDGPYARLMQTQLVNCEGGQLDPTQLVQTEQNET